MCGYVDFFFMETKSLKMILQQSIGLKIEKNVRSLTGNRTRSYRIPIVLLYIINSICIYILIWNVLIHLVYRYD